MLETGVKVKFCLMGDFEDIQILSSALNIGPAKIRNKKDFKLKEYAEDSWTIATDFFNDCSIEDTFSRLYSVLKGKEELINQLKEEYNLESIVMFIIKAEVEELPIFILSQTCIDFASKTKSDIHFDNYFYK